MRRLNPCIPESYSDWLQKELEAGWDRLSAGKPGSLSLQMQPEYPSFQPQSQAQIASFIIFSDYVVLASL
jgi:hypothetical protein